MFTNIFFYFTEIDIIYFLLLFILFIVFTSSFPILQNILVLSYKFNHFFNA